jgi:hypothetical protein
MHENSISAIQILEPIINLLWLLAAFNYLLVELAAGKSPGNPANYAGHRLKIIYSHPAARRSARVATD